jgi:uncharacterized RDD family membrane protein YckC
MENIGGGPPADPQPDAPQPAGPPSAGPGPVGPPPIGSQPAPAPLGAPTASSRPGATLIGAPSAIGAVTVSLSAGYGTASGPRAGFWRRFGAWFVDGVVVWIAFAVLVRFLRFGGLGLWVVGVAAYFTYFEGAARGQTPGKSALDIRVIGFADGRAIGHKRAFVRWIGLIISFIPLLLGYFWMLWDREKQCWQDKLAGSVVVPVSAYPPPR